MKLSPTTVATIILESDTPQIRLYTLAELMGLDPNKLLYSHIANEIRQELCKELTRLQRKQDQLQSLLDNSGPLADLDAKAVVGDAVEYVKNEIRSTGDILERWNKRFPYTIPPSHQ